MTWQMNVGTVGWITFHGTNLITQKPVNQKIGDAWQEMQNNTVQYCCLCYLSGDENDIQLHLNNTVTAIVCVLQEITLN